MSKEHKVHKEIIIIGAGMSGIAAAAELVKNGKDVLVLEGRERLGGRICTDRKSGSEPYELGACWFHQSDDNPLKDIAKKHGIEFQDDNELVKTVGEEGEFPESLNLQQAAREFAAFAKDKIKGDDISLRALVDQFIRENKDLSTDQIKLLPTVLRAPQISHGVDWTLVSGKQLADDPKGKDLLVTGGYDKIYEAVRGDVKDDQIILGAAVKSIDSTDPNKVVLETADHQYTANHVICTIPLAVLKSQHVFFKPELPSYIKNALEEVTVAEVGKSYLEFDEQFWIDGDKFLYAGQYPFFVSNWGKYGGKNKHPGLAIISTAPLTRPIESAADEEAAFKLVEPVLSALRKDHTKPVPKPKKVTVTNWTTDIFSQGSYATFTVGTDRAAAVKAFAKGVGRVRFAGEHTIDASEGATFAHGAYRSGVREAMHILSH